MNISIYIALILLFCQAVLGGAVKIKNLTSLSGSYEKEVSGYGLVIGLDGTGDGSKSMFTVQSVANMLSNYGINVNKSDLKLKNVAAVIVRANLPTSGKKGSRVDVSLSSIGDAKSLQGGTLLLTPLTDPQKDGQSETFVTASGSVSIGGFNVSSGGNSKNFQKNYTLAGRIPGGGIIEKEIGENLVLNNYLQFNLNSPDFTTARRVAQKINSSLGEELAFAEDQASIRVRLPQNYISNSKVVEMVSLIENLEVEPENQAKIVVNERTGTIVIGENVKIDAVAISHGNLSIKIDRKKSVSQPNPMSQGKTESVTEPVVNIDEEAAKVILSKETATLKQLVDALNHLGVTPRDMISILQALKEAGALHAELVLI